MFSVHWRTSRRSTELLYKIAFSVVAECAKKKKEKNSQSAIMLCIIRFCCQEWGEIYISENGNASLSLWLFLSYSFSSYTCKTHIIPVIYQPAQMNINKGEEIEVEKIEKLLSRLEGNDRYHLCFAVFGKFINLLLWTHGPLVKAFQQAALHICTIK